MTRRTGAYGAPDTGCTDPYRPTALALVPRACYVAVQLLTFGLRGLTSAARGNTGTSRRTAVFGDVSYFRALKQAKVAPPSWVFGPAWTVNNVSAIWGMLRVLNTPDGTPGREEYLALQGLTWLDFVLFNAAYFSLRSPINAFVLTVIFLGLSVASGVVALVRLKDTAVALSLATTVVWLLIAVTAATFQALWYHDDFYAVGPFAAPLMPYSRRACEAPHARFVASWHDKLPHRPAPPAAVWSVVPR